MDFYKRVETVCLRIPYGKAATYGQIALLCGKPNHARQVGYALSHRKVDEKIPAHRIVNSRGFLTGAGTFEHPDTQRRRLAAEGIAVSAEQYVNLERDGWKNTLEDALELREYFEREGI